MHLMCARHCFQYKDLGVTKTYKSMLTCYHEKIAQKSNTHFKIYTQWMIKAMKKINQSKMGQRVGR